MANPRRIVLVAAIAAAVSVNAFAETRRAVVIGIDKYVPKKQAAKSADGSAQTRGAWIDLDGAVNDAEELGALLQGRFAFPKDLDPAKVAATGGVVILRNDQATRDNIIGTIKRVLVNPAVKPGDVSVVYYAGHGSQMFDSESKEADKLDETIVPADSALGQFDIRDKELSRLLNDMLGTKAIVTAIFDSCHSGSISRGWPTGKARYMLPDKRDAAKVMPAVDPGEQPEAGGALILSAAHDTQVANETTDEHNRPHGLFTAALLRVLRSAPLDMPAADLVRSVQMSMDNDARGQKSELAANDERRKKPLLGIGAAAAGKPHVAGRRDEDAPKEFILDAGSAIGLAANAELKEVTNEPNPLRLKVTEVMGLSRARAQVVGTDAKRVKDTALFEIDKWVPADRTVRLWWEKDAPTLADIQAAVAQIAQLAAGNDIVWVTDPTLTAPDYVVRWNGKGWAATTVATGQVAELSGLTPAAVLDRVNRPIEVASAGGAAAGAHGRNVYIDFPAPREVAAAIAEPAADRAATPAAAQYVLQGRLNNGKLEYAWVVPNLLAGELQGVRGSVSPDAQEKAPLPPHTDWLSMPEKGRSENEAPAAALAADLSDYAYRLARLVRWREIQPPPDNGRFPYRLAFQNAATGAIVKSGPFRGGERYYPVLVADGPVLRYKAEHRYAYVFVVDSTGAGNLLFPVRTSADSEAQVPYATNDETYPAVIKLGGDNAPAIRIRKPFGVDTYIVLTSADRIEGAASVFNFSGVVRELGIRGSGNPLSALLGGIGSGTRGAGADVPTDWSIERLTIESTPPPDAQ